MTPSTQNRDGMPMNTTVPVLMYHSIAETAEQLPAGQSAAYSVRASEFKSQLQMLKGKHRSVVTLSQLSRNEALYQDSVVLTFDDGCATDHSTALPLLQEFGFTATFFLSTANIGTCGYITWEQAREMHKAGMQFGSHAHEHIPLTPLQNGEVREQLQKSKAMIEDQLGASVTSMSAPFGFLNGRVVSTALEIGYEVICGSTPKMARPGESTVPRIAVMHATTPAKFEQLLNGDWRSYLPAMIRSALVYVPRQILLHVRPSAPGVRTLKRSA
jgi:peptidoglycan/xylan/chitin deacetylase (PgdA/CDA1 family)